MLTAVDRESDKPRWPGQFLLSQKDVGETALDLEPKTLFRTLVLCVLHAELSAEHLALLHAAKV